MDPSPLATPVDTRGHGRRSRCRRRLRGRAPAGRGQPRPLLPGPATGPAGARRGVRRAQGLRRPGRRARLRARGARAARLRRRAARPTSSPCTTPSSRTPSPTRCSTSRSARCPRPRGRWRGARSTALWSTPRGPPTRCTRPGMAHGDIKPANVLLTESDARRDRRQALRPRPRPLPRARRHAHEHGPRQLGGVRRPGRHRRGAAVAAHRDLGARRHRAPRAGGHRPLRRAARRPAAAGDPEGARRRSRRSTPRCGRDEAELVRRCLAPDDGRLPTAEAVADRLAALRP